MACGSPATPVASAGGNDAQGGLLTHGRDPGAPGGIHGHDVPVEPVADPPEAGAYGADGDVQHRGHVGRRIALLYEQPQHCPCVERERVQGLLEAAASLLPEQEDFRRGRLAGLGRGGTSGIVGRRSPGFEARIGAPLAVRRGA